MVFYAFVHCVDEVQQLHYEFTFGLTRHSAGRHHQQLQLPDQDQEFSFTDSILLSPHTHKLASVTHQSTFSLPNCHANKTGSYAEIDTRVRMSNLKAALEHAPLCRHKRSPESNKHWKV
eukprot:3832633-Amphidinium_carterae.1